MMGLGPVQSIKGLLKKTNVNMDQVEAIEVKAFNKAIYFLDF